MSADHTLKLNDTKSEELKKVWGMLSVSDQTGPRTNSWGETERKMGAEMLSVVEEDRNL